MARNVEIKARVADPQALRDLVEAVGATGPEVLVQIDTFFNAPSGRLKLREFGDGSAELIAYDRPDVPGPKVSEYLRTQGVPAKVRESLAQAMGIRVVVKKRRLVFLIGQTRVHLDEVEGLGSFVEFEVVLSESQRVEEGERIASGLMEKLGISRDDLVAGAYADLLQGWSCAALAE